MPAFKVEWAYLLAGANRPKKHLVIVMPDSGSLNWMDNSLWNRPWSRAGSRFRPSGGRCCPWVLGVTCVLLETQEKQPNKSVHGWLCEVFQLLWKRFVYAYFVSQGSCFLACYDSLLRKLLNYSKDYFFAFPMLATFGKMWRSKKQGF